MREVVPPMRVIQRTLVYVMGLSPRIAKEDILRRHEYFGQYGKILRIQVNSAHMHSASNGPPSCSCYITYSNREEAEQAILAVDNVVLDGRALKASFGTTKAPHAVAQVRRRSHQTWLYPTLPGPAETRLRTYTAACLPSRWFALVCVDVYACVCALVGCA
jgi:hypothetical protein